MFHAVMAGPLERAPLHSTNYLVENTYIHPIHNPEPGPHQIPSPQLRNATMRFLDKCILFSVLYHSNFKELFPCARLRGHMANTQTKRKTQEQTS